MGCDVQPELEQGSNTFKRFQQKKRMALFLLKTKEVTKVSQVAVEGIIEDFTLILQETICSLREEVNSCLITNGLSIAAFDGLPGIFDNPTKLYPFRIKKISTESIEIFFLYVTCINLDFIIPCPFGIWTVAVCA